MIKRRPNWEIVLNALQVGEEQEFTIEFPNGLKYGWLDGRLCVVLPVWKQRPYEGEPDEYHWLTAQDSLNYIIEMCEEFTDADIMAFVHRTVLTRLKKDR